MTEPAWAVEHRSGTAEALHDLAVPDPLVPTVWVLEPIGPALVLGSTQARVAVDEAALATAGVTVVRRRSGGGAVLLEPGGCTWVDVLLPRHDPRWVDDVGRSTRWLGRAWQRALGSLGIETSVHEGPLAAGPWGALVCFAGVGPGEVLDVGGAKVVGISQRRTRAGARFQCLVHHRHDPERLVTALGSAVDPDHRAALVAGLDAAVATVAVPGDEVVAALVAALDR